MTTVWRIEKEKRATTAGSGEGARIVGGRWTSPGHLAVYCAEHLSLAILEVLVHSPEPDQRSIPRLRFRIRLDSALVYRVPSRYIPADFSPRTSFALTQAIGDDWLREAKRPALSVPSAIVPAERNYILNPLHPAFERVLWGAGEPVILDNRLWTAGE